MQRSDLVVIWEIGGFKSCSKECKLAYEITG